MKDKIIEFFKNKFNIALIVIQALGIVSYFLSSVSIFFVVLFFLCEGLFFVLLGVRILKSSTTDEQISIVSDFSLSDEEKQKQIKTIRRSQKNSKLFAGILIVLGIILFFSMFSIF